MKHEFIDLKKQHYYRFKHAAHPDSLEIEGYKESIGYIVDNRPLKNVQSLIHQVKLISNDTLTARQEPAMLYKVFFKRGIILL